MATGFLDWVATMQEDHWFLYWLHLFIFMNGIIYLTIWFLLPLPKRRFRDVAEWKLFYLKLLLLILPLLANQQKWNWQLLKKDCWFWIVTPMENRDTLPATKAKMHFTKL